MSSSSRPDPEKPLFGPLRQEIAGAQAELDEMARLRWQLAKLEGTRAVAQIKRLAIVLGIAAVMVLTSLPVLVVWSAETLAIHAGVFPARGWMLLLAMALLATATAAGWLAYRRFRRQFTGLEETLEELREDMVWLREWAGREKPPETADHGRGDL